MDIKCAIPQKDLEHICSQDHLPWEKLRGRTVLITGATGIIGYALTSGLLYADRMRGLGLTVLALVRDEARARDRFAAELKRYGSLRFLCGSVEDLPPVDGPVDHIIHGASPTASRTFVQRPVETLRTAALGTFNMLELAREKHVSGFLYVSSVEVYGPAQKGRKIAETEACSLRPQQIRGSYPAGKLLGEELCCAYAAEYGVPAVIVRPSKVFGSGARSGDVRIFAECMRCAREKRDIVLRTPGEAEYSYLYTADAATALLTALLKGEPGTAYNAADERTYCSVAEMAERIARANGVRVRYEIEDRQANGYPDTAYLDLDTSRLRALGWAPGEVDLHLPPSGRAS